MIQILFEGLIRTMREYVEEKKKYFQKVNDIQNNWEYSDLKKCELSEQEKTKFNALKEKFIEKFTGNINSIKKAFQDKQKNYSLDNAALHNAMFFIANTGKKKDSDFSVDPELIGQIASEFIGDTRSMNMLVSIAESNGMSKTALDRIKKFAYSIKSTGNSVSKSAVQRYASNLMESLHTLRMAQENFRAIMEETEKYKNVDFTEPLTRLLCSRLLEQINRLSDEQVEAIDIETLTKNAVALTRAVAYKRNVDAKTNTMIGNGVEQFNEMFFQAIRNDKPELYKKLKNFLNDNFKTS